MNEHSFCVNTWIPFELAVVLHHGAPVVDS